ncbi:MAG: aminotransferase class V-fold PLP-dependent enzyme [Bacteroidota bacterium]
MNSPFTSNEIIELRQQFPILTQRVNGFPLVYFDNAATTQKPNVVIQEIVRYYSELNSNIHRGAHYLANKSTELFEETRESIKKHISAKQTEEIIFTQGCTDSLNLVAFSLGSFLQPGDEVWVTEMEHHANFVPWQLNAQRTGAIFRVIPITENGEWDWDFIEKELTSNARIVAFNWVSNALGTVNDAKRMCDLCERIGAYSVLDGAQAISHLNVNVQELGCDFFAFSAHKMYGPTGLGVLYGKLDLLNRMPPYRSGGEMIKEVRIEETTFQNAPFRFETGTPNIEAVIAFKKAIDFVQEVGKERMHAHEQYLTAVCENVLISSSAQTKVYGSHENRIGVLSFQIEGVHASDLGTLLDQQGIAVRTGHHCAQPIWNKYGVNGSARVSFACYNTVEEVEHFQKALMKSLNMLL